MASSSVSYAISGGSPATSNPSYKHALGAVSHLRKNRASFGNFSVPPVTLRSPLQGMQLDLNLICDNRFSF
jgi:hypothetical protein